MEKCDSSNVKLIEKYLENNKAVLMETDTVLGIFSKNLELIYKIKERSREKKIVLFVKDVYQIDSHPSEALLKLTKAFWPGKLTIIYKGISYRIPNNDLVINTLNKISPIYCSSANTSGEDVFKNSDEAFEKFKNNEYANELLVVKGVSKRKLPSTIYSLDENKVLREGEITLNQINEVLTR